MSTDSIQFAATDSSTCRILTVASTLDRAVSLVDRVRSLRKPGPASTSVLEPAQPAPTPQPNASGLGESTRIPWTLSNKYYSADVHFAAHTITGLSPHVVRNVHAVIFVWSKGDQDFRHHVERLAGDMSGYEPEVSLAVRLAPSGSAEKEDDSGDAEEEEAELDEFLSSNGFEFIDASEETPPVRDSEEDVGAFSQGIPGLPRVLDALSTIMWPSMQAKSKLSGAPRLARRDFDWAETSQDDMSPIKQLARGGSNNKQHEMDELTRWLEGDDDVFSKEDPWRSAADSAAIATSPTETDVPISPITGKEFGFDDDFTVFVSAPPVVAPREVVPDADDDFEDDSFDSPTRLGPPESSPLYLSLGSALDLREVAEEKDKAGESAGEDEDLPTDAEIEAMSSRIFGAPVRSKSETAVAPKSPIPDAVPVAAGEEEYDMAPFDLSRVMSALEGMKAEIASMEDEGERRKAAAKVALGLVYGLEADAGIDDL
ncbi:hypothetical protein C8F04DRAFT_1128524 [Mycena alexandri]|uniref:Uncharacterized protein n=1 Tax=Mycena alexandri TaxID=1745969 RepID=A0AAD6WU33_9AGAR|nr:hypothetical protein C8F04DRAFT_1128524 [Mycena alexandri]